MQIDLNADMGESFGMYKMGNDEEFMEFITSANIACGFHAGDPSVMRKTVMLAKKIRNANRISSGSAGFARLRTSRDKTNSGRGLRYSSLSNRSLKSLYGSGGFKTPSCKTSRLFIRDGA